MADIEPVRLLGRRRRGFYMLLWVWMAMLISHGNLFSSENALLPDEVPYGVVSEPWPEQLGSHRARIRVSQVEDAVRVHIPWRRHDADPEQKATLVYEAASGRQIDNVVRWNINREFGDLVFQARAAGEYYAYYFPFDPRPEDRNKVVLEEKARYIAPQSSADPAWVDRHRLGAEQRSKAIWQSLPVAEVMELEARSEFDSFYPMEVVATRAEVQGLVSRYPGRPFLLFPEGRNYPIRMDDYLPLRWIKSGPQDHFQGHAYRNEFYVFQIGIYAREGLVSRPIAFTVHFEDLRGPQDAVIPALAMRCFNLGGVDENGRPFPKKWSVAPGHVGALWFGIQVPLEATPGPYEGRVALLAEEHAEMPLTLHLEVDPQYLRDGGVDEPQRLARLKWLDSSIGLDDQITAPYVPLQVKGATVACLGRRIRFAPDGLLDSIQAGNNELLRQPIALRVYERGKPLAWQSRGSRIISAAPAKVIWESTSVADNFTLRVRATMEFDGNTAFDVKLASERDVEVSDIALEIPFVKTRVPYIVGMGLNGGKRPEHWQWHWTDQPRRWKDQWSNLEYFVWLGGLDAGLFCRLKSPLPDWKNGTIGGVQIDPAGNDTVLFRAYSGPRCARANEEMSFSFRLLPTPLKPLDPNRWKYRYAQTFRPLREIQEAGATVLTFPVLLVKEWGNYPYLDLHLAIPYIQEAHRRGLKAKIYLNARELTTRLPELWALRSLGNEIYRVGGVQGHGMPYLDTWLQEHLVHDYAPGWVWRNSTGEVDATLRTVFDSRWNNCYVEGLKWLLENAQIDGIYLDEISYSREVMQRVRRVMDLTRPGSLIDLHGNRDYWSCNSPIGYYMEHLPYVDQLWFGEAFDPDSPPDFYLIEMSGLPFGLSGELLQDPNPWRGMLFGLTARAFYTSVDPSPIWRLWDEFGIQDSEMLGYWNSACPVTTGEENVPATVYRKRGKSLIAIASWVKQPVQASLKIDWLALGLNPKRVTLGAPALQGFQKETVFKPAESIPVEPGRGWLLLVEESK